MYPINQGSEVIDVTRNWPGVGAFSGEPGLQLGTDEDSIPSQLGPVDFELGIIAGTRSINILLSRMIPGVDDGKVSVENTKLTGMSDHIEMDVTHTFMMRSDKVIAQVLYYLEHGKFKRN